MLVVDTSVIMAVADSNDRDHDACDSLLADRRVDRLLTPVPVIVETAWMIESRLGPNAEAEFLRSIADEELTRVDLSETDWVRVTELVETYADLGLGTVDASIVTIAERYGVHQVATLNHRDFRVVRPRHIDAFELLPGR